MKDKTTLEITFEDCGNVSEVLGKLFSYAGAYQTAEPFLIAAKRIQTLSGTHAQEVAAGAVEEFAEKLRANENMNCWKATDLYSAIDQALAEVKGE